MKSTRKYVVSKQAHIPGKVSKTDPSGAMGTLQTCRTTGHIYTPFCFRRARKYIHHQKNYKVFGTSHFLHCWEQSFMCFKTASSFPVRVAGDCYQAGSKTLPDCPLPTAKCCGSSRWPLNSATRPQACILSGHTTKSLFS